MRRSSETAGLLLCLAAAANPLAATELPKAPLAARSFPTAGDPLPDTAPEPPQAVHTEPPRIITQVREELVAGNPQVGTVVICRQKHAPPFAVAKPLVEHVAEYQEQIVRHLAEQRASVVFAECIGLPWSDPTYNDARQEIARAFSQREMPARLNSEQQGVLFRHGAALVYGTLNPCDIPGGVTVLPAVPKEQADPLQEKIEALQRSIRQLVAMINIAAQRGEDTTEARESLKALDDLAMELMGPEREKCVGANLQYYLRENPGTTVYVVFGMGHVWDKSDFPEGTLPRVSGVSWPTLDHEMVLPDPDFSNFQWRRLDAADLAKLTARQEERLRLAKRVDLSVFPTLTTPELQTSALKKGFAPLGAENDPWFVEWLRATALSDAVRERISLMSSERVGPFGEE